MSLKATVSRDKHFAECVDAEVRSKRCSESDIVRARSRLLESPEAPVRVLRDALKAGETSGDPATFDGEIFLARMRATHGG